MRLLRRIGSWSPADPTTSKTPVWLSRSAWLAVVAAHAATEAGRLLAQNNACQVSRKSLLAVARIDAERATGATGRNVKTSHATVARQLGCSSKTVQRARTWLLRAGLAIEAVRGRYLAAAEIKRAAHDAWGGQRRIASTRHLLIPRHLAHLIPQQRPSTQNVHLPRRGSVRRSLTVSKLGSKRADARKGASKISKDVKQALTTMGGVCCSARSLCVQRLAAGLVVRMSWLVPAGGHMKRLCGVLVARGVCGCGWSVRDVLEGLEARGEREQLWYQPSLSAQRSRLALFSHQLRGVVEHHRSIHGDVSPRQVAAARHEAQEAARARQQAQRIAEYAEEKAVKEKHQSAEFQNWRTELLKNMRQQRKQKQQQMNYSKGAKESKKTVK